MLIRRGITILTVALLVTCAVETTCVADDELAELRAIILEQNTRIDSLINRIDELERKQQDDTARIETMTALNEEQAETLSRMSSKMENFDALKLNWSDKVKFSGDFRYRHEYVNQEGSDNRNRHLIRARVGLQARLSDELDFHFRLATGDSDNQVSTNQTLTDSFSSKNIWLDLAYLDWRPAKLDGLNLYGGKMRNPFYTPGKTELIWDGDLTPEGVALKYNRKSGDIEFFGTAGGFWVQERKNDADSGLWGAQAGLKVKLNENIYILGGGSYYDVTNTEGQLVFGTKETPLGNSANKIGSDYFYTGEYSMIEGFAEMGLNIRDCPVTIFGEYLENTEFNDDNTAYLVGLTLGKCTDPGTWALRWNYRRLESDSVLGAFTDSSFMGGGTDGKGHEFGIDYQLTKPVRLGLTYFHNEKDLDLEKHYRRLELDVNYRF